MLIKTFISYNKNVNFLFQKLQFLRFYMRNTGWKNVLRLSESLSPLDIMVRVSLEKLSPLDIMAAQLKSLP